jgi:hypothetical protein
LYGVYYKPRVNRSLPQNRPGHPDFVRGKNVVRNPDGSGEHVVDLTSEEAKAPHITLQWGKGVKDKVVKKVMNDQVTSGKITKNKGAHKKAATDKKK